MSDRPRWMSGSVKFKHRESVESVLGAGGSLGVSGRIHRADQLAGIYQIRLNIAQDPAINPGGGPLIDDLKPLVSGLKDRPSGEIVAWTIRGRDGLSKLWLFEDRATGEVVACLNFEQQAAGWEHDV